MAKSDRTIKEKRDAVLPPESRDALKHLEIVARRNVEGILHGEHKSKRKGVSTEFDHHKVYQPGDPLRHVDWKVSARHDTYFIKRYLEDTALTVNIVVDVSGSMRQQTGEHQVYLQAARMAASLAYLIVSQRDRVGMVLGHGEKQEWFPPSGTEAHLVRLFTALASTDPAGEGGVESALNALLERNEYKGILVLITDLMFDPEPIQRQLGRLGAQGHELLLMQVADPTTEEFPFNRWVVFQDLEVPGLRHRVDAVPLKKLYREEYENLMNEWREWARKQDAHFVPFRAESSIETVLGEYLNYRQSVLGNHS